MTVAIGLVLLLGVCVLLFGRKAQVEDYAERRRHRDNARIRQVWRDAGGLSYPHTLADGRVRWYHVDRDPVEL